MAPFGALHDFYRFFWTSRSDVTQSQGTEDKPEGLTFPIVKDKQYMVKQAYSIS